MTKPFVIGVTGGIAMGKSAVLTILAESGFETIDADQVYHELIKPGAALYDDLIRAFGAGIIDSDGTIDRRALGAIVFSDTAALARLDALTHPAVVSAVRSRIAASTSMRIAIDAVKLIESGMADLCDSVWLVVADPKVQIQRLVARNGLSQEEATRRIASQPDESLRRARVDHVIDNSGTRDQLRQAVTRTLAESLPKV